MKVKLVFFLVGEGGEGPMLAYFGRFVQKIRIWVVMESNGLEMDYMTTKTPDNMYHT